MICDGELVDVKLTWQCNYCPETYPNFRELLEHYEQNHNRELRRFEVRHLKSKSKGIVSATNSEEACEFFGWNSQECKVKQIK